jgi:hypothetical protein
MLSDDKEATDDETYPTVVPSTDELLKPYDENSRETWCFNGKYYLWDRVIERWVEVPKDYAERNAEGED